MSHHIQLQDLCLQIHEDGWWQTPYFVVHRCSSAVSQFLMLHMGLTFELLLIICYSVGGKTSARAKDCCTESTKHCWVCHFLPLPLLFLWKGRFCLWLYRCNRRFPLLLLLCSPAKQILMWFSKWVCISREKRWFHSLRQSLGARDWQVEGSRLNTPAAAGSWEKNFASPSPDGPFKLLEYQQARGMSVVGRGVCLLVQVSWSFGTLDW